MNKNKIANPTKFYQHPNEVIKDRVLSDTDKIKILENWLDDVKLKLVAEDEGMTSTGSKSKDFVREINNLLASAKEET